MAGVRGPGVNCGKGGPGRGGKVRFRILGPLEVWTGQDWGGIGAPKWRALLAALLLNQGQAVSTDRLIAELWGDDAPDRAANLVSVYVLRLRRVLGDPEGRVLTTRAPGYRLLLQPGDLDAESFESLAGQGRKALADGDPHGAAAALAEALGLWRGRALADVPSSALVTAEAERLEESRLTALELRIEADMAGGLHAQLVPELRRLLSDQPLREGLWGLLIRALDGAGRHAEALAAYGQARGVISEELGVDPGPELQRLYQALLAADATAPAGPPASAAPATPGVPRAAAAPPAPVGVATVASPAPAGATTSATPAVSATPAAGPATPATATVANASSATPTSLATPVSSTLPTAPVGPGAPAGYQEPAAGYQEPAADGAAQGSAPGARQSADAVGRRPGPGSPFRRVPAQLPADVADFTGRVAHLARLRSAVSEARQRSNPAMAVAVVAGAPGLGKTALAIHAAHALRPDFPDGQLYVSLLGGSEQPVPAEDALARLLRDLGVDGNRVPLDAEERAAMYRTRLAERQMLIVLDDARDAAQVRPLLPGTGSCSVIVTSRHTLSDLVGSRLIDLDVLDDAESAELFNRIIGSDRANAELDATRDVLAFCAGLPLAIRIAGARLAARRSWKIRTLAGRLADQRRRMDEFTAGDLAVRACFQVSFDALPRRKGSGGVDAAHAFRMLGVWQGPSIELHAAAALIGAPEERVTDALEVLVDAHLLECPAPDRYRLHDLLRAYAAERAQADEAPAGIEDAMHRILDWYLRTADAAASVVAPYRDRVPLDPAPAGNGPLTFATPEEALAWCEQERSNLVAATRQAAARGLHDIAWKLPVAAAVCFDRLGYRTEWLATHDTALASARELGDRPGEAWVLTNIGTVLGQQHVDDAIGYFEQALAIAREVGDREDESRASNNLAFTYVILGRYDEAVEPLLGALELQRALGRRYGEAVALCNLGEAYVELGRYDEAITRSQEALAIAREIGSERDEGYALYNLGRADLGLGRLAEAEEMFERALPCHRTVGDKYGEAHDLHRIGAVQSQAGRLDQAREAWTRARGIFEALGEDELAAELRVELAELGARG
jgi:DNA-binding SARP family transcriptional activator/tetratricopeptide (TPR) repeat protein